MLGHVKRFAWKFLNKISYIVLSSRKQQISQNDQIVAVFVDYLDASFLLASPKLNGKKIVLFCTHRSPLFQMFRTGVQKKIAKVIFVENYAENQYDFLVQSCKNNNVEVVMIQAGDFLVPAYNYVNCAIGAKGNSELAVACSLDKGVMRAALNSNNISPFKMLDLKSKDDIEKVDFYPCVLKPKIGTFSEGVVLLQSKDDFYHLIDEAEKQRRKTEFETGYIVEEYIEGRQFDVEGIVHNGELVILSIVEENYTGFFPYFNINWFFFNAFVGEELYNKIYDTLQRAFVACGMLHGAYHCELRIDKNGDVRILEFSNRMGGGFEKPISDVTGSSFADLYVESMLDILKTTAVINKNHYLLQKYFQYPEELEQWKEYLKRANISYSFKPLFYRGHIGMMNIYHHNKEVMLKIAQDFDLIFKTPI
ncbi:acetyl-CoA carboxylase biotin carboxylase subunit family protein [Moraxella sp. ZY210820]|uniref:ATP-grasp domain-containing protein n=1 Tax=unclassified Moraxella TaxID=2685852 RepID=UPI00273198B2|nr:ATP-grasp domain-containing protein [Moraxella sp. ZY210820]WLF83694.1 ATP-grasp domain-containing protein [Moraxella sp. ZY210820]